MGEKEKQEELNYQHQRGKDSIDEGTNHPPSENLYFFQSSTAAERESAFNAGRSERGAEK